MKLIDCAPFIITSTILFFAGCMTGQSNYFIGSAVVLTMAHVALNICTAIKDSK